MTLEITMLAMISALTVVFIYLYTRFRSEQLKWELKEPIKKKGSFPLYYEDRHMANIRGKEKAKIIIEILGGKSKV